MDPRKLSVLLVSDDPKVAAEVRAALAKSPGFEIELLACSHAEAGRVVLGQRPVDVAVYNSRAAEPKTCLDGLRCLLRAESVAGAVIALPSVGSEELAAESIRAGAADYITRRGLTPARLLGAVLGAHERARSRRAVEARRRELDKFARYDELTGLLNIRALREGLVHEMWRAKRYGTPLSLLLAQIEGLGDVRLSFGTETEEIILSNCGEAIRQCMRATDLAGRHGAADFGVILTSTDLEGARKFGDRLARRLRAAGFTDPLGRPVNVACTIGMAELPEGLTESVSFFALADQALLRERQKSAAAAKAPPPAPAKKAPPKAAPARKPHAAPAKKSASKRK